MSDPRIRRRIRIRRKLLVALYAACLAGVSIALLVWIGPSTIPHSLEIPWLLVAGGFFAVEATALHIEVRRQTHSLSLAGFPLLLGILALNPAALVAARLVGGGLALAVVRRRSGLKLAWNLSLFAVETGVAVAIAGIALTDGPPAGMSDWLILLAAILAAELTSLIAVPTVIMIYEGELRLALFSQIGRSQAIAAVSSTFAIVVGGAMLHNPQLLVIAMMPLLAVAALLRIHGRLGKEHDDLQQLHGFTTAIGGRDPLDVGLRELTTILRTRGAALAVARDDGGYAVRALVDDRYTDRLMSDHILLAPPLPDDLGEAVNIDIATSDGTIASLIRQLGGQHGMGTSVLNASDERALIIVFDRLGATRNFSEDEQRLFSSLAATLGTRLSADRLLDRLELQARMDHLTRLANRSTLEHALDERLVDLARPGALVVLDLDRFKDVNDSLGHQFGDQMLRAVAERLQAMIGETDLAARLGGDEFAVLLDDIGSLEELEITVEALADRVGRPLELDGIALDLSVSIGIAAWPGDAQTSADLLRLGDIAMYEAKRTHQAWVRYVPTIDHASPNLLRLMGELRDAIQAQELVIHLQPQVRTRDLDLIGAEALVRWNHPKLGMVPPGEFLPAGRALGGGGRPHPIRPRCHAGRRGAPPRPGRPDPVLGQPDQSRPSRPPPARQGGDGAGPARPPRLGAHPRSHRELAHRRHRRSDREPGCATTARMPHLGRRLRDGVRLASVSPTSPAGRGQDRPLVRRRSGHQRERRGDRALDHEAAPGPRPGRRG